MFFTFNFTANQVCQHGIVDLQGRAAGYTGNAIRKLQIVAEDINVTVIQPFTAKNVATEKFGDFSYAAQANIVSLNTVQTMTSKFEGGGCDLADRLFKALTAVDDLNKQTNATSTNPNDDFVGDVRCEEMNGYPGYDAFVHVHFKDGKTKFLHLESKVELIEWSDWNGIMK